MVRITTINVCGLNDPNKRKDVFDILLKKKCDIFCLQETHCDPRHSNLWMKEWGGESLWNGGNSQSRGVAILLHPKSNAKILESDYDVEGRILSAKLEIENDRFNLVNIYGPNTKECEAENNLFFELVESYLDPEIPNIMCGDFNMVENIILDRRGGTPKARHNWGFAVLKRLKDDFDLCDIWRELNPDTKNFTFLSNAKNIQSRLDRFYISGNLQPQVKKVDIVNFSYSDHDMVYLDAKLPQSSPRGPGYWKLNSRHLFDDEFRILIRNFWAGWREQKQNYANLRIWWDIGKIKVMQIAIDFGIKKSRKTSRRRNLLLADLRRIKTNPNSDLDSERRIREELRELDKTHFEKIRMQTKLDKMEHDEKPTKFFYDQLKYKQHNTTFSSIFKTDEKGNKVTSNKTEDILHVSTLFYDNLYTQDKGLPVNRREELLDLIDKQLDLNQKAELDAKLTKENIREALNSMDKSKSPGWDGIPYEFYQTFWNTFEDDFFELQNEIFDEKCLSLSQQRALISLLYKDGDKRDINNWRPLSLLCTDYKILAKAIATKVQTILPSIISEDQTCCVPGRTIHSNLLLTRDIIHYTKLKQIKGYIITVDQMKAFDVVDRDILFKLLERFNFGQNIINMIKTLYNNTQSAVYINGHFGEIFKTTRGLRQGCPLSAILYVIYSELLGNLVRKDPKIKGIPLPGTKEEAKVSQYADDNTFFLSARTNVDNLFKTLAKFEQITGSKLKPNKTKAICLNSTTKPITNTKINWQEGKGLNILGIHFFADEEHTLNYNWGEACDKLENHITQTQCRKLSFKGKVLNLNSIGLANFWYLAAVFPFPKVLEKTVNKLIFNYLWGENKREDIRRETLLLPKDKGGLGIYKPSERSIALRAKSIRLIVDQNVNLKWCFIARYYLGFQLAGLSDDWKHLRNNQTPKPDRDILPFYYSDIFSLIKNCNLKDVQWTTAYLYIKLFTESSEPQAMQKWSRLRPVRYDWKTLWTYLHVSLAPGKYQELHYKFIHRALPTKARIVKWQCKGRLNPNCSICLRSNKSHLEHHVHLFFDCPHAFAVWRLVKLVLGKLLPKHRPQCYMFTFALFPSDMTPQSRKLTMTLVQLTLFEIWINRNKYNYEHIIIDPMTSFDKIKKDFSMILRNLFKKMKRGHNLVNFRKFYCDNDLLSVNGSDELCVSYP